MNAPAAFPPRYSAVIDRQAAIWRWLTRTDTGANRIAELARYFVQATDSAKRTAELEDDFVRGLVNQYGAMLTAPPYVVDAEICGLIELAAKTLQPWYIQPELFPTKTGFVWFDRPSIIPATASNGSLLNLSLDAVAWDGNCTTGISDAPVIRTHDAADPLFPGELPAFAVTFFARIADRQYPQYATDISQPTGVSVYKHGDLATEDSFIGANGDPGSHSLNIKLQHLGALLFFMRQKLLVTSEAKADRATRRRNTVDGVEPPAVNIVRLRSVQRSRVAREDENGTERQPIEYSHRWMVGAALGGFWNQYHVGPGRTVDARRWIMPFIKGPESKPLKLPAKRVMVAVDR